MSCATCERSVGARGRRGARRLQHLHGLEPHMVEAHRAAVGLALAEGVPVRIDGDALDARRQRGDQRRAGRLVPGREGQQVRAHRARAEALDAVDAIAVQLGARDHAAVQRIERIAPEQVARHGRLQEVGMLLGRAIEQHPGHLQMVETEYVRQRAVGLGQPARRPGPSTSWRRPRHARSAPTAAAGRSGGSVRARGRHVRPGGRARRRWRPAPAPAFPAPRPAWATAARPEAAPAPSSRRASCTVWVLAIITPGWPAQAGR